MFHECCIFETMRRWVLVFILFFALVDANAQELSREEKVDTLLFCSFEQLGTTYKWGTSDPFVSFDCSGFACYAYSTIDVNAPRSSSGYADSGVEIPFSEARPGDCMVFTGTEAGSTTPGHVGIIVSNDQRGIYFIHCSSSKKHYGVVVTHYETSGYPKRFHSVRRMFWLFFGVKKR